MGLRKIFTYEQGINPPGFDRIAGQLGLTPTLQIDDATGLIYNGGVLITPSPDPTMMWNWIKKDFTSTDILNFKATPGVLIPALDAGLIAIPTLATLQFKPVSIAYTLGDATQIFIGTTVNPLTTNVLLPIPASILNGAGGPGNTMAITPAANQLSVAQSWFENQSLVITHNGSGELTLGDATISVKVYYAVVSVV